MIELSKLIDTIDEAKNCAGVTFTVPCKKLTYTVAIEEKGKRFEIRLMRGEKKKLTKLAKFNLWTNKPMPKPIKRICEALNAYIKE